MLRGVAPFSSVGWCYYDAFASLASDRSPPAAILLALRSLRAYFDEVSYQAWCQKVVTSELVTFLPECSTSRLVSSVRDKLLAWVGG